MRGIKARFAVATAAAALGLTAGLASTIVKQEPPEGHLRVGQHLLIDDGSCPPGQIKELVGGSNRKYNTTQHRSGVERIRHCIPR